MRAQTATQATPTFAPTERIPFDSAVTTATLPNGLRYYIRKNARPEKRVMMQLAVKAGSVDEAEGQQGLAHFLEHMAFNGTKRFKAGELIAALESTGSRMGPHVNAYTSFDETVHTELPTDRPAIVEGIQALTDFAGGMTLDPKEIDKARRRHRGMGGVLAPARVFATSRSRSSITNRVPSGSIGKPEVLKAFPPAELRDYYTKWYRPDRMAVVVVGDIDLGTLQALVAKEFGALAKPSTPAPDRTYPVPIPPVTLVKVATDREVTQSSVAILRKRPSEPQDRVRDYTRSVVQQIATQMLNDRFDEISRKPDAPFLDAGAFGGGLSTTVDTFTLSASVQEGKIEPGLAALEIESNRVEQHGFGPAELERAKWVLAATIVHPSATRRKADRACADNGQLPGREPSPGIAWEHTLVHAVVPNITQAEVTNAAKALFGDTSRVIIAISPQKADLKIPTDAQLTTALASAESVAVMPWNDAAGATAVMEK
jgi:zinc protease